MKSIALSIILLFSFLVSANQSFAQTPVDHMNELTSSFAVVKRDTWKYVKAATQGKPKKIEKTRIELLKKYKTAKSKVAGTQKSSLRTAAINYLDMCYTVLKEDYDKILDMQDIAEQSYDLMEAYMLAQEKAGEKLEEAFEAYKIAEKEYAAANNIELRESDEKDKDKVTKKIDKASDALKYYNKIYLIFFKSYKQEAYAMDALNRADISSLEQNANSLGSLSEEGLGKLKEMESYKGYGGLKTTASKFLNFYKTESEKDFPVMIDFYLKKEAFEKAQADLESKSKKSRTQEDVDKYNAASAEYNKAVNLYNEKNNAMNTKRTQLFEEWNETIRHFFDNYSK
jgi:hypothetical protein